MAAAGGDVVSVLPAADDDPIVSAAARTWACGWPRCRWPLRCGPTTRSPSPTARRPSSTSPAPRSTTRPGPRSPARCTSTPPARGGSCCRARCRRARRSTGTPSSSPPSATPAPGSPSTPRRRRCWPCSRPAPASAPDLLKPNTEELAQLAGVAEEDLLGDPDATLAAVRVLHDRGVAEVLLTLGGDGALLSTADGGLWSALPPAITVRSTVGAGDSSLAGYLLADLAGAPPAERLRTAVAYGSAAASLPGSAVPTPAQVDGSAVRVTPGAPADARTPSTAPTHRARHLRPGRRPGCPLTPRERSLHARSDHHRPGRARRRPGRRQGRGRAPAGRTGRRRPAGPPTPTRCTPTPSPARPRRPPACPAASRSRTAARRR